MNPDYKIIEPTVTHSIVDKQHLFDEQKVLLELKHYLPAQAPLKDFIHHNTLHAFQHLKFQEALNQASSIFGYQVFLPLDQYKEFYKKGRIKKEVLERIILERKGIESLPYWMDKLLNDKNNPHVTPRIGSLRTNWKKQYKIDLDGHVHPILFRILCSYLDQGISVWNFPIWHKGFLPSIREIERNSYSSFFKSKRAQHLLLHTHCTLKNLLEILVGDESLYEQYLFDQQFAHPGWSGLISAIEDFPETLLDRKKISLHDLILLELLLEIDELDFKFGQKWEPLAKTIESKPIPLFSEIPDTNNNNEIFIIWQEAFEWCYYDEVLNGLKIAKENKKTIGHKSFQAMFCIDDRSCSMRRYLEKLDPNCETFGTPGFFGVEFYFKPEHGKFYTKLCPAPINPKYLIKEVGTKEKRQKDAHFAKCSHGLFFGWIITQTLGFWSAIKLFLNIFRPTSGPATASSFNHMDRVAKLTIENKNPEDIENHLQIGFTIDEMTVRVEALLRSIGLIKNFAPIVYVIGHGSSSVNNPHYAAYDCGACSGRPGSVNARVICHMANHPEVRKKLVEKGIEITAETKFVGGLHDTTRDELLFFDEKSIGDELLTSHIKNQNIFYDALALNAKERSRRFASVKTHESPEKVHEKVRLRSVSLFEPRPELNHATNAICIIGRRHLTKKLFLDRRAFLNSYDYRIDPEGVSLSNILNAAAPVCGGINLEYFFSRVDNEKLGAGSKLPHNVMGLIGVANGIDGDLRPGLPQQMVEVHDPVRLLMVVEHDPAVVLKAIQKNAETYEWFSNDWIHLIALEPGSHQYYIFKNGQFTSYSPSKTITHRLADLNYYLESSPENLPVYLIQKTKEK